jgi:ATP-binding cassette subfamily B protein RaxB
VLEPDDFIAITGPSGGGKTTLLKLLLGIHEPTAGEVLLSGRAADQVLWRSWRRAVGVVTQDDMLLSGSIAENIAFFDPHLDMSRIVAAAKAACVHDEIERLAMGYQSLIGEMGSVLSGGQRQRLLLARALYRDPRHLFLDEGTANLDLATEEKIAQFVSERGGLRVIIAHRPALVRRAHRVLHVENGCVLELAGCAREMEAAE